MPGSPRSTDFFIVSEGRKSGNWPEEAVVSLVQCWTYCKGELMQKSSIRNAVSYCFFGLLSTCNFLGKE